MSSVELTPVESTQSRLAQTLERNGTLVIVVATFTLVMIVALRHSLVVDGWLALVSGRWIAGHGLPTHDVLNVWTHGRAWIDQQWLAQLTFYGLWRLGGITLVLLAHATLTITAVVIVALLALRLGASARSTAWVCVAVEIAYYPVASVARPQSFAYPLFAATLWLLFTDARRPSNRVYATLPLLVLWTNLHGSVALGAAMVSLAGVVRLVQARRPSALALVLLPWACVFASPYALGMPAYYRKILVGGDFKHFVTEWAPTTLSASTAAVYVIALGGMWLLGRSGSRLMPIEKIAFLVTAGFAFQAVRNTAWLALTALAVLPVLIDGIRRPAVEPARLNRLLATSVLAGVAVAVVATSFKPAAWCSEDFQPAAAEATDRAAAANGRVFASSSYADWLLWSRPRLQGRVAFDARFELLEPAQLRSIAAVENRAGNWLPTVSGYDVFVLDRSADTQLAKSLQSRLHLRLVYRDPHIVVLGR